MRKGLCDAKALVSLGTCDLKIIAEDIGCHTGILEHPIMIRALMIVDEGTKAKTCKSLWLRGVLTNYAMSWGKLAVINLPQNYAPLCTVPLQQMSEDDVWNAVPTTLAERMSTAVYLDGNKPSLICAPAECFRLTAWARDGTLSKDEDQLFAMFTLVLNALKRCKLILPKAVDVIDDEWYKNSHDAAEQVLAQDAVHMANTTAVSPVISEMDKAANLGAPKRRALNVQLASANHGYAPLYDDTAHPSILVDPNANPQQKLVNFAIADSMARVRHVESELLKATVVAAAREEYPSARGSQFKSSKDEIAYNTAMQQLRRLYTIEKLHGNEMEADARVLLVEMRGDLERSSAVSVGYSKGHDVGESMKMLLESEGCSYLAKYQDEMVMSVATRGNNKPTGKGGGKGGSRRDEFDKAEVKSSANKQQIDKELRLSKVKAARSKADEAEEKKSNKKSKEECTICDYPGHLSDNCAFNPKSDLFGQDFGASIRARYMENTGGNGFSQQNSRARYSNFKGSKGSKGKGKGGKGKSKGVPP